MASGKPNVPTKIIVHHTAVRASKQSQQFAPINEYHKKTFGAYCLSSMGYHGGYHILIEPNGAEFRYREDNEEGCHTKGQNIISLGVALSGNFDVDMPTNAQVEKLRERLATWTKKYDIKTIEIKPHRKFATKSCYGNLLSDDWAEKINVIVVKPEDLDKEEEIARLKRLNETLMAWIRRLLILLGSRKNIV